MKINLRNIALALVAAGICLGAVALDLPVRRIDGKDYYVYTVQRGESLIDVANRLGVTRADIIAYNPGAADGVRMGLNLFLPVSAFTEADNRKSGVTDVNSTLRYKVQKGETLFGIAYRFGVTPDAIVALNPDANTGVKSGQILMIPNVGVPVVADVNEAQPASAPVEVAPGIIDFPGDPDAPAPQPGDERRLRPVIPTVTPLEYNEPEDSSDADDAVEARTAKVALLLPLMLNEEADVQTKSMKSSTDFVRGFMLGLQSNAGNAWPMDVAVYDTEGSADKAMAIMRRPELSDVDLVIAPEDAASLRPVADSAPADAFILNLFAMQDTTYLVNPHVLQANIPAAMMYEKAAEALMAGYDGYQPVFLISKGGRGEKLPFTNYLREQYEALGVEPIDLMYEGMLTSPELEGLDRTGRYVFIPQSGHVSEFNKFARPLITLRDEFADPTAIAVFGYPDWTLLRGEHVEDLHRLGATIYSRFYTDASSSDVQAFNRAFVAEYGREPQDQVPSQALWGYDAVRFIVQNITDNEGAFVPEGQQLFRGLQSSFLFMDTDGDELTKDADGTDATFNQAMYIVNFLPGGGVSIQIL